MDITLRNEIENDYKEVEKLTREAFWNLHVPGCDEHYLVHTMRQHPDFVSDLDFVALHNNEIVGNIMYAKTQLVGIKKKLDILTFGPVSVLPSYQRKGIGTALIRHTIDLCKSKKVPAIVIFGHPHNCVRYGFKNCIDYHVSVQGGKYPYSLLVLELTNGILEEDIWTYQYSDIYHVDTTLSNEYDKLFTPKEKSYHYSQEDFAIACRAFLELPE